ncbi:MAG: gamma-glutamyltransferase family protein, partial [Pseudomonadota bacterium]
MEILKSGGNAMDAAISAAVLLGICEPHMTGIGGDCFVLYSRAGENEIRGLNGSGRAPLMASADTLREQGLTSIADNDVHSVTLPGAVDAFCHLAETEGKLGLDQLLAPAIHYAELGVPVAPRVAQDWHREARRLSGAARTFYLQDGRPPAIGTRFSAPGQAEVLRRIARDGRDGFYSGEVAQDMLGTLGRLGGCHTPDDLARVSCTAASPISGHYKDVDLIEHPPNGQGATAILMLNALAHFDIPAMEPAGAERAHIEAEVTKLAHDARNQIIADPDHTTRLEYMLSPDTAARLAGNVDPKAAQPAPVFEIGSEHKDTVYLTVVDRDQMAVSLIYSIYHGFGSGIASDKFGILMQNRGCGFTLDAGHPNEFQGGKRPLHTIIPGMLRKNGRVTMPFGVMGGAYQPTGHSRFLSNIVDFGYALQQAIDAPRSFADAGELRVERGYADAV